MITTSPQVDAWIHELTTVRSWMTRRYRPPVPARASHSTAFEKAERARPQSRDKTLSALVPVWLAVLPVDMRPRQLCHEFPRIANRIALCWPDATLSVELLDRFFIDQRAGRRGFPLRVVCELTRLRALAIRRMQCHAR